MAFNGSGTFNLAAGNPVTTGTTISSTWANSTLSDVATGLTNCITRDGQSTPLANIPMGNYKLTGLGQAASTGDALAWGKNASVVDLAASGTVTLSGGTANGVGYLNASKVFTTGSALTFDGTNLGVGVTPSAWGSTFKAFQINNTGSFIAGQGNFSQVFVGANSYYNGSNWIYSTSRYATRYYQSEGGHYWETAPSGTAGNAITFTQAMTLDASGNLGIGTSSPNLPLCVGGNKSSYSGSNIAAFAGANLGQANGSGQISIASTDATAADMGGSLGFHAYDSSISAAYPMALVSGRRESGTAGNVSGYFAVATTASNGVVSEKMRVDSSGNLLVGYTSLPTSGGKLSVSGDIATGSSFKCKQGTNGAIASNGFNFYWATSSLQAWIDTTNVGTVTLTSDYRIKKNIEIQTVPAINRVMQLRPVTYEFADFGDIYRADGVTREGFIAHELQEVIPSAVEGEKDAENQIQSLKLDALCSVMVKAIQEQQAIIEQLTTRIATLEAK